MKLGGALGSQSFKEFLIFKDADMFACCPSPSSVTIVFLSRGSLKCLLMETKYANTKELMVYMSLHSSK